VDAEGRSDTPLKQKRIWLVALGAVDGVLLFNGGLTSLQESAIATGLPLAVVLLLLRAGRLKGLLALHLRV
jgi:Bacterial regulatory helix-turn-helix protein, lysR family/BCCT, betaine/carnitine/choline family transporter